jgi:glutathione S-transferase
VPDETLIAVSLQTSATCLRALQAGLGGTPFLAGDTLSLADLHAYPMLQALAQAPEGAALLAEHEALQRWFVRMAERPSVRALGL